MARKNNGRFWWNSDHPICHFWWNFSFPDRSFSTKFLIPLMCRFRWNFGNYMYPMFKYFLFKTIFQRFTPGKQRIVSLLKDFGIGISYQNIFWRPTPDKKCRFWWNFGGTNMSFWVEFGEIQYVIYNKFCTKLKINELRRKKKQYSEPFELIKVFEIFVIFGYFWPIL